MDHALRAIRLAGSGRSALVLLGSGDPAPAAHTITVDGEGQLHPSQGDPLDVIADRLYAVVVRWDPDVRSSWLGWLTTAEVPACPEGIKP